MFQNHVGIDDVSWAPHLTKEGLAFEFLWARLLPAAQGEAKNTAMTTSNIVQELQERNHVKSCYFFFCHFCAISWYDRSSGDSHPWTINPCPLLPHPIIQNALTYKGPVQTFFQINEHGTRYFEVMKSTLRHSGKASKHPYMLLHTWPGLNIISPFSNTASCTVWESIWMYLIDFDSACTNVNQPCWGSLCMQISQPY